MGKNKSRAVNRGYEPKAPIIKMSFYAFGLEIYNHMQGNLPRKWPLTPSSESPWVYSRKQIVMRELRD
jgi:hypothetical protein